MPEKTLNNDPLITEIALTLRPGEIVGYMAMFEFTEELEKLEGKLRKLTDEGEASRAVFLYEVLFAGVYDKIAECDDSADELGMFWTRAFCGWVKARQAAGCPATETVQLILRWIANDAYAYCHRMAQALGATLDDEGYRLLAAHYRKRLNEESADGDAPFFRGCETHAIKDLFFGRGDVAAYAELCEQSGFSAGDCKRLAQMEMDKSNWAVALEWVERGLLCEESRPNQGDGNFGCLWGMKIKLLGKTGRREEALSAAWADFSRYPSTCGYDELMQYVPDDEKDDWHGKALNLAASGGLTDFIDFCVHTGEWQRLGELVLGTEHEELEKLSHYCTEPAADGLVCHAPLAAAKVYRALALRILASNRSKYYDFAIDHLRTARRLYQENDQMNLWHELEEFIRARHYRKTSFMPGFENMLAGKDHRPPSFLDQARARWQQLTGEKSP